MLGFWKIVKWNSKSKTELATVLLYPSANALSGEMLITRLAEDISNCIRKKAGPELDSIMMCLNCGALFGQSLNECQLPSLKTNETTKHCHKPKHCQFPAMICQTLKMPRKIKGACVLVVSNVGMTSNLPHWEMLSLDPCIVPNSTKLLHKLPRKTGAQPLFPSHPNPVSAI